MKIDHYSIYMTNIYIGSYIYNNLRLIETRSKKIQWLYMIMVLLKKHIWLNKIHIGNCALFMDRRIEKVRKYAKIKG